MHFDVDQHTLFLTLSGSHAYGMARPTSDVDVRGVCLPPLEVRESLYKTFDQYTAGAQKGSWGPNSVRALNKISVHPTAGQSYVHHQNLDLVIFSLKKFLQLASNANPNVFELLFVDESDVLFSTDAWEKVKSNRDLFLSKKVKFTYTGYAFSQLKRIKGHREWLLNPPKAPPTRKEFGLPEESVLPADVRNQLDEVIQKIVRNWTLTDGFEDHLKGAALDSLVTRMREFQAMVLACKEDRLGDQVYELAGLSLGLGQETLYAIKQERAYRSAQKHWRQYQTWKGERNEARAELEAKHGFDTKHGSHLIRLMRTGLEILKKGEVIVHRPDADELLAIRNGEMSYEALIEEAEELDRQINEAYKTSSLPKSPDLKGIDELYRSLLFA